MGIIEGVGRRPARERLSTYASLVRLPNVFTAPPDVIAGAALAVASGAAVSTASLAGLAVVSALVYAAGTTLNDYFDADVDAVERPERPIPSGRVSRRDALALGVLLLAGALVVATVSAGVTGGAVTATLAALVVLYDGFAKDSASGFAVMGATRGVNVLLGTAAGQGPGTLPVWAFAVPVGVTAYVAALTWTASNEAQGGDPTAVGITAGFAVAAALLAPVVTRAAGVSWQRTLAAGGLGLAFLAFVARPFADARRDPTPARVGRAIGKGVLGLVILESAVAAVAGLAWSALALAFLLPAVGLAELFDVS